MATVFSQTIISKIMDYRRAKFKGHLFCHNSFEWQPITKSKSGFRNFILARPSASLMSTSVYNIDFKSWLQCFKRWLLNLALFYHIHRLHLKVDLSNLQDRLRSQEMKKIKTFYKFKRGEWNQNGAKLFLKCNWVFMISMISWNYF